MQQYDFLKCYTYEHWSNWSGMHQHVQWSLLSKKHKAVAYMTNLILTQYWQRCSVTILCHAKKEVMGENTPFNISIRLGSVLFSPQLGADYIQTFSSQNSASLPGNCGWEAGRITQSNFFQVSLLTCDNVLPVFGLCWHKQFTTVQF